MKYTSEILEKFPELNDIALRLEESEKEFKKWKSDSKERLSSQEYKAKLEVIQNDTSKMPEEISEETAKLQARYLDGRGGVKKKADEAYISRYLKNGVWVETVYPAKPGKKEFLYYLERTLNQYDPDALIIKLISKGANPSEHF